jgi:hypothetical protein
LYYNDANSYPTTDVFTTGTIDFSGTTYMAVVPGNPSPKNDGDCPDSEYTYTMDTSGSSYHIVYCLGGATGGLDAGTKNATPAGIDN